MALRFRGLDGPLETVYRKDSGSPPQAVDPYTQAAAQYGLSTGTALFNAGLNRTNQVNPLGSTTWSASYPGSGGVSPGTVNSSTGQPVGSQWSLNSPSGFSGLPTGGPMNPVASGSGPIGGSGLPISQGGYQGPTGHSASGPGATIPFGGSSNGVGGYGLGPGSMTAGQGMPTPGTPYNGSPTGSPTGGAPTYTQQTSLTPWANQELQKPIDTSGLAGMPGGPSTTQDLSNTRDALYQQQMQYLQPEQDIQKEQLQSQLANMGATIGSPAYNNEMDRLNREQEFQNSSARTSAIAGGGAEQSRLFGLGTQGLQNQLAVRNAPISEWAALNGSGGASAQALTPDISGAFNQQLQSQMAGYNANVASNNQTTADISSLAMMALMFSDKRLKEDIRPVGKTEGGLPIYTYRYKGDSKMQMGVMAQDVEKEQPEAYFSLGGKGGIGMVDYGRIE